MVWWDHKDENVALPYMAADCAAARQHLLKMPGFSPAQIDAANVTFEMPSPSHMLRRRDIVELFDNSASIEGLDIDVGCYVRDSDDSDVSVFWRPELTANAAAPRREELCSVPVYVVRAWMNGVEPEAKKGKRTMPLVTLFRWNHVDGEWCRVVTDRAVVPGVSYMASCAAGGYVPDRGWAPKSTAAVPPVAPTTGPSKTEVVDGDANDGDALSFMERWVSLRDHATHARDEAEQIVARVPLPADMRDVCVRAAQAHDLGKAHPVFQETMNIRLAAGLSPMETWAKSGNLCRHKRRGFRHELASALAWLIVGPEDERDLIAYLLAAHHGKVRASLRALAKDAVPEDGRQHARGVWQGDEMPCADLGDGLEIPAVTLSLDVMPIGDDPVMGPSWVDRVSRLLARFGPFRLMYLEMVVRAADVRATRMERLPR